MGKVQDAALKKAEKKYVQEYHSYCIMKDRFEGSNARDEQQARSLAAGLNVMSDKLGLADIWIADGTKLEIIKGGS